MKEESTTFEQNTGASTSQIAPAALGSGPVEKAAITDPSEFVPPPGSSA